METTTIQEALTIFQQNGLSNADSQWQRPECNIVARMADGRKVRQVNDMKYEVSLYKGNPATASEVAIQIDRLRRNYTQMKPDFFAALANELAADEWPIDRIKDAVTHVLRSKNGGFIAIADIFNYDKPMKLYNHSGYMWLIDTHRAKDNPNPEKSDFGTVKIDGKVFFYLKKDLPTK